VQNKGNNLCSALVAIVHDCFTSVVIGRWVKKRSWWVQKLLRANNNYYAKVSRGSVWRVSQRALECGADGAAAAPRLNEEGTGGCAAPDLGRLFALCRRCDHACEHNRAQCTIKIYISTTTRIQIYSCQPEGSSASRRPANPSAKAPQSLQTLCYYLLALLAPGFPHCVFCVSANSHLYLADI
jgi:hypothetical protein